MDKNLEYEEELTTIIDSVEHIGKMEFAKRHQGVEANPRDTLSKNGERKKFMEAFNLGVSEGYKESLKTVLTNMSSEEENKTTFIPYQLCPKCNGQGTVSKPPYLPGDVYEWSSTGQLFTCDVCNGAKIIPQFQSQQTQPT